ncbi:MAG TPA: LysM domain-containing protein, partial [Sphingobium sp.]|nr:LysM domain-containing protein [Sphingobium sp.]
VVKAPAADPARAARLRAAGLAALNQGQVARAVVLLHQAATLAPADPLIRRDLERAQRIRATVKTKR